MATFRKHKQWSAELERLREIALSCDLLEEMKWGKPCYTLDGRNVVLIHEFKEYVAYLFFKGALLKDPKGILVQQTENTQSTRQIRFTRADDISKSAKVLKQYILEAIKIEAAGEKVPMRKTADFDVPSELQEQFENDANFQAAFEALTPGRQRGYLLHFASAKQSKTRASRIAQSRPRIMESKGLHDD